MSRVAREAHPGRFIVVEGVDGAGSTTQSRRLVESLRERGHDARLTCEPSAGPIGRLIREAIEKRWSGADPSLPRVARSETLALLFAADRLDHLDNEVLPALRSGAVVVSDRYDLSSLAYQSLTSAEGDAALPWIRALNRAALRPDLTLVLDVSTRAAAERRRSRGGAEELFDADSLQERLARAYADAERLVPSDALVHIAGDAPLDVVSEHVLRAVLAAFPDLGPL